MRPVAPPGRSGRAQKISPFQEFEVGTVHTVANLHTVYFINKTARVWKNAEIKETPAAGPRTVEQMKHASVKTQACPYIFCNQC
jgi:hypothetical protein